MADLSSLVGRSSSRPSYTPTRTPSYAPPRSLRAPSWQQMARSTPRVTPLPVQRFTPGTPTLPSAAPRAVFGGAGGGGGRPASILGQLGRLAKGVPAGIAGLVTSYAKGVVKLPYDLTTAALPGVSSDLRKTFERTGTSWTGDHVYDQEMLTPQLRQYMESVGIDPEAKTGGFMDFAAEYAPLPTEMSHSLSRTYGRFKPIITDWDFSQYRDASGQGRTLDTIIEDIGNIAIVGGTAARALGRTAATVEVGSNAARAAVEGRIATRSAGAAVAEGVEAARPLIRPRVPRELAVTETGNVIPMTVAAEARGTGLAGYAQRAGYETLANNLARAGTGVRRVTQMADAVDNIQFAYPIQGAMYGLRKLGVTPGLAKVATRSISRFAEGDGNLASFAQKFTPEYREVVRQTREAAATLDRDLTRSERLLLEARIIEDRYDLAPEQSRAALFDVDDRFMPLVRTYEQATAQGLEPAVADQLLTNAIERAYSGGELGKPTPDALRPTLDDVKAYVDWRGGRLDDVTSAAMDQVRESVVDASERRTKQALATDAIGAEQLDAAFLPDEVEAIRRDLEKKRDEAQTKVEVEQRRYARAERIAAARIATNTDLIPPDARREFKRGKDQGLAETRAAIARNELRRRQAELNQALREYEKAESQGNADMRRIEAELDRKIEQVTALKEQVLRTVRTRDAAGALTRVQGAREGQGAVVAPRPTPDLSQLDTVTALRTAAREVSRSQADQLWQEIERMTGGSVPILEGKWWEYAFMDGRRARDLIREGFIGRRAGARTKWITDAEGNRTKVRTPVEERGTPVDVWIGDTANRSGLPEDQVLRAYFDAANAYIDAKRSLSPEVVNQLAQDTGIPAHAVQVALTGTAAQFREVMAQETVQALNDIRDAFDNLDPNFAGAYLDELRRMREEGASPDDLADFMGAILDDYAPGSARLIEPVWGKVPMEDLTDWLTGREISSSIYEAVVGKRGSVGDRAMGKLQERINQLRIAENTAKTDVRSLRRMFGEAQRTAEVRSNARVRSIADAAKAESKAASAATEAERVAERMGDVNTAINKAGDPWRRYKGSRPVYNEDGTPVLNIDGTPHRVPNESRSRAERMILQEGALAERAAARKSLRDRHVRSMNRYNDKIAQLDTELNRSHQDRLREDINKPAIKGMAGTIREIERPLGMVEEGIDGTPYITGVIGDIADRYGFTDEAVAALEGFPAGDAFGKRVAMRDVMDELGVRLDDADWKMLERSFNTDLMLERIAEIENDGIASGTSINTPFRIIEEIRATAHLREVPNDVLSTIERKWEGYLKRRNAHLSRLMDDYAAVMPGRYRAVGSNARRLLRGLLDEAEAQYTKGNIEESNALVAMAEDVPTTLERMVSEGIDPIHLTGGEAPTRGARTGTTGIGPRKLRAESKLTEGLRPVDLKGVVNLEIDQMARFLTNQTASHIIKTMGKRADAVAAEAIADWAARHPFDRTIPEAELLAAVNEAGWVRAPGDTATGRDMTVIPRAVADELRNLTVPTNPFWQFLNTGNRWFKTSVLPLSPKWMTGNVVGNAFMATFQGGLGPHELAKLLSEIAEMEGGWREFYARGGLPAWAPEELASHGLTYNEHILRWGDDKLKIEGVDDITLRDRFNDIIGKSYNLNEFVDNATRAAVYLAQLRKGASPEMAAKHALNAMGDFTRMTPFERRWVRQVFPFYPWLRHQTLSAMRLHATNPARAAILYSLTNMMNDPEYGEDMLALLGSRIPLGGDSFLNIGGLSPFAPPFELPLDPTRPESFMQNVTPVLDAPIRALTGYDISRLRPVSRPQDQLATDSFGRTVSRSPVRRLFSQPINALGEMGYQLAGELPQTRSLRDLALAAGDGALGDFRYGSGDRGNPDFNKPRSLTGTILGAASLPWPETVDIEQMLREQREREREERRNNR